MANTRAVTDEQLIAALMQHGTIKAAAAAAGISERSLYDRMNSGDFRALYQAAKADILRTAVLSFTGHIEAAINTIAEIMQDSDANAAVRLQAAKTILDNAGKFSQRLQIAEASTAAQEEANKWDL